MLGPFDTLDAAEANVSRGRRLAGDYAPQHEFDEFGTTKVEANNLIAGVFSTPSGRPARTVRILNTITGYHLVYAHNHLNAFRSTSYEPTIAGCYVRVAEYNLWSDRECDMILEPAIRDCLPIEE